MICPNCSALMDSCGGGDSSCPLCGTSSYAESDSDFHARIYGTPTEETTTRHEHVEWAKARALDYCRRGELQEAFASMASDLGKHDETRGHVGLNLGLLSMLTGQLSSPASMEAFILGFN